MPSIANGQIEEVYCPVSGSLSVTPGSGGRVSVNSRNRKGGQAIAPREVYSAETFSVSAGDVVLLEAIGAAASYSSVPGDGVLGMALATTTGLAIAEEQILWQKLFAPGELAEGLLRLDFVAAKTGGSTSLSWLRVRIGAAGDITDQLIVGDNQLTAALRQRGYGVHWFFSSPEEITLIHNGTFGPGYGTSSSTPHPSTRPANSSAALYVTVTAQMAAAGGDAPQIYGLTFRQTKGGM